jgi:Leucine-rich repeat (LRR) protein
MSATPDEEKAIEPKEQSQPEKSVKPQPQLPAPEANPDDVKAAVEFLEKAGGSAEKNAAGTVVKISDQKSGEAIDAIAKLIDLESLVLDGPYINDAVTQKLANLHKLKTLSFSNASITDDSLKIILDNMKELTNLTLNRCNLTDDSLDVVCQMKKLKILDLRSNDVSSLGMLALADLKQLEQLDLRYCVKIDGTALDYLSDVKTLRVLKLRSGNAITDRSLENLEKFEKLQSLHLQDSDSLGDVCIDSLVKVPTLTDLALFRITSITNDGIKKFQGSKIEKLLLRGMDSVTDEGIASLKEIPKLTRLVLQEMKISDAGLSEALNGKVSLTSLAAIDVPLTNEFHKTLAALKNVKSVDFRLTKQDDALFDVLTALPKLETLIIGDNTTFTDAGFAKLAKCPKLKSIEIVNNTRVTDDAIEILKQAKPGITIKRRNTGEH